MVSLSGVAFALTMAGVVSQAMARSKWGIWRGFALLAAAAVVWMLVGLEQKDLALTLQSAALLALDILALVRWA